jgi:hypothetical protein
MLNLVPRAAIYQLAKWPEKDTNLSLYKKTCRTRSTTVHNEQIYSQKKVVVFNRASKMFPHDKLTYPKKSSYNVIII